MKEAQPEEDPSVAARLKRLENEYETAGMRRSVEAILVVHEHGHPHVLMMQIANTFFKLWGPLLGMDGAAGTDRPGPSDPEATLNPERTRSRV